VLQKKDLVYFGILLAILIPLEFYAAHLAFETLSELASGFYYFIIIFNLLPIGLFFLERRTVAMILCVGLAAFIIPYQLYLGYIHSNLKEEAANITNYVYDYKLEKGVYPKTIANYKFKYPELKQHFRYSTRTKKFQGDKLTWIDDPQGFQLSYYVGTTSTSHFYNPKLKQWGYYPD
jgi:hypothetical protein